MRKATYILLLAFWLAGCFHPVVAQYPGPVGALGSTALDGDSTIFISWAITGTIERGPRQIDQPELGLASHGSLENVFGPADNATVSLGDGGQVTLFFPYPIIDGPGWDFAVFENGFAYNNSEDYFLELAFVEVSSDGTNFVRFPATSLTPADEQVGPFEGLQAENLNNLAGKYEAGYGTPFDVADLPPDANINPLDIRYVRIIDVVGNIDPQFATYDSENNPVNDPWPTPYPTSGFDLDAVGVIHDNRISGASAVATTSDFRIGPNPTHAGGVIYWTGEQVSLARLINSQGQVLLTTRPDLDYLRLPSYLAPGVYTLYLEGQQQTKVQQIMVR